MNNEKLIRLPKEVERIDLEKTTFMEDSTSNIELPMVDEKLELVNEQYNEIASNKIPQLQGQMDNIAQQVNQIDLIKLKYIYGAIGDGLSHKISTKYETLEKAREKYRCCTSLDDEIDWCAIQQFILDNGFVQLDNVTYITNNPLLLRSGDSLRGLKGTRIIKINNDTRIANGFKTSSLINGFNPSVNIFTVNAIVVLYHTDDTVSNSCEIKNITLQGSQNISNINDIKNYATYGVFAPLSSNCNYENVGLRCCEYGYYTNDSFVTNMQKMYFSYCKNGLVHEVRTDVPTHFWTGTSLHGDNLGFSNVNLPIDVNHLAYSTLTTITIDSNVLRTNGISTKVMRVINSMLTINTVGVEGVKMLDNDHLIDVYSTNDSYGNLTGIVTINNLDFEANVYGGNNSNVFCCNNAILVLNEPHLVYADETSSTNVVKAINNAIVKFNNPSKNFSDLRNKRVFIDGTSKVFPLYENKIVYGTSAPTTGTWNVGDMCINTNIANGTYERFLCSVGGTSGTWLGINQIGYMKQSTHPTTNIYRGYKYWNTSLNKMLQYDGSAWLDYNGVVAP